MRKIPRYAYLVLVCLCSLWMCLLIWIHRPWGMISSILLITFVFLLSIVNLFQFNKFSSISPYVHFIYWLTFLISLLVFFCLVPRNDRQWQPEVDKIIQYQFVDGQVEIQNVRNFIWHTPDDYQVQWETRRYSLEDINQVDLIVSHFIPGPVAHVFMSFGFKNGEHLAFSLEVRQEKDEGFSTIGGFFRQYELALVVGDENDVIYARTNIRDEDVYIYPITMQKNEMQILFLEYLNKANRLNNQPRWYNTLVSNCTTILFDLVEYTVGRVPRDYRVVLPGLLPEYLHDYGQLAPSLTVEEWKQRNHVNPKTEHLKNGPDDLDIPFSKLIRQDIR
ncbi:hypothetical protein A3K93_04800 [Acinetobacter sp. NCu2D-2]|nr:hypothetical protein A3K93_04800 [Acinetobacter sp. NCu2D-2]